MKLENNLGTDAIRPLVLRIAIPSMLAQFVSVLYSIVDRIYISNIPLVGETALAGVGVCGPVVTLIGAFASLIGVGGAPLMSIRMGAGKTEEARRILSNSFLMLCVCSVALMAGVFPLRQPMLMAFGASDATYGYANTYFTVYLCGTVFNLLALGLNQFIICQGYARKGMISVMLGAALNIVLDPVFIFLFDMGVAGAAVATVLSQLVSCLYVLRFLFGKSVPIAITFGGYDGRLMLRILAVGMTPFLIIGVDNIMIISMNAILQSYGGAELGDRLVTCATIAQSFMLVVTMPLGGISAGTGTILAYNYGARRRDRILKAQAFIAGLCVAYVTALFLLARLGGALFVRLFTTEPELAAEALSAIHLHPGPDPPGAAVRHCGRIHRHGKGTAGPAPVRLPEGGVLYRPVCPAGGIRRPGRILCGTHLRHRGAGGEHRSLCPVHPADSGFPRGPARCGEQVHAAILIDKAAQPKAVPLCLYKIVGSDRDGELL